MGGIGRERPGRSSALKLLSFIDLEHQKTEPGCGREKTANSELCEMVVAPSDGVPGCACHLALQLYIGEKISNSSQMRHRYILPVDDVRI